LETNNKKRLERTLRLFANFKEGRLPDPAYDALMSAEDVPRNFMPELWAEIKKAVKSNKALKIESERAYFEDNKLFKELYYK